MFKSFLLSLGQRHLLWRTEELFMEEKEVHKDACCLLLSGREGNWLEWRLSLCQLGRTCGIHLVPFTWGQVLSCLFSPLGLLGGCGMMFLDQEEALPTSLPALLYSVPSILSSSSIHRKLCVKFLSKAIVFGLVTMSPLQWILPFKGSHGNCCS